MRPDTPLAVSEGSEPRKGPGHRGPLIPSTKYRSNKKTERVCTLCVCVNASVDSSHQVIAQQVKNRKWSTAGSLTFCVCACVRVW